MKRKIGFFIFSILFIVATIALVYFSYLQSKKEVTFVKCLDGDSLVLRIEGNEVEVRLIGIDCPELYDPYGMDAKRFSEDLLKKANNITIEKDLKTDEYDKYNRLLVWLFVDDELLQYKLIEQGLAKTRFIYDDYAYSQGLFDLQELAKTNKKGVWSLE